MTPQLQRIQGRAVGSSTTARPLLILALVFVASRVVFHAIGVTFDLSPIDGPPVADPWQLLDLSVLQHHLLSGIWNLDSQPPIFNALCGILLKLPSSWQAPWASLVYAGFGLVLVLSAFQAMVDLAVPRWASFSISLLIIIDPSFILYENWLSYAYLTASALTFSVLCSIRYLRTKRWGWGLGFFSAIAFVALLDSTYQWAWVLVVASAVGLAAREPRRKVAIVAMCPLILVASWSIHDYVEFGTLSTSSWLGMNLAQTTLQDSSPATIRLLVRDRTLSPLAEIPAFSPVTSYIPRWVGRPHTGVSVLDRVRKSDGTLNYNNLAYVRISSLYLRQDLDYISAEPASYVKTVGKAASLWMLPSDDYPFVSQNRAKIAGFAQMFDRTVLLQPSGDETLQVDAIVHKQGPSPSQVPYGTLLVFLIALAGSPILVLRLRRSDRERAVTLFYVWFTISFAYVVASLTEFAENERMRFQLGALPIIAAATVTTTVLRERTRNRGSKRSRPGVSDRAECETVSRASELPER